MEAPFDYLHELYRIVYLRSEAQAKKAKEEEEARQDEERKKKGMSSGIILPPGYRPPIDAKQNNQPPSVSPIEAEALEDALEELTEGGMV